MRRHPWLFSSIFVIVVFGSTFATERGYGGTRKALLMAAGVAATAFVFAVVRAKVVRRRTRDGWTEPFGSPRTPRLPGLKGAIWYLAWLVLLTGLVFAVVATLALVEGRGIFASLGYALRAGVFILTAGILWRKRDSLAAWLEGLSRRR